MKKDISSQLKYFERLTRKYNFSAPHLFFDSSVIVTPQHIRDYWVAFTKRLPNPFLSLYIHIPFCLDTKCKYCMYNSLVVKDDKLIDAYLQYIFEAISLFKGAFEQHRFSAVYIGGGTPTILNNVFLSELLKSIRSNFRILDNASFTYEVSPRSVTEDKVRIAAEYGVNRISIGVQSLNKKPLEMANRAFVDFPSLKKTIEYIKSMGFREINVDLLGVLPGDTVDGIKHSFEMLAQLKVSTITLYFLRLENSRYSQKIIDKYITRSCGEYMNSVIESIDGILDVNGYYRFTRNPYYSCQKFIHADYKPELTGYPTVWESNLRNSCLGLGFYSRSFMMDRAQFTDLGPPGIAFQKSPSHINSESLRFSSTRYSVQMVTNEERMRNYVLEKFNRDNSLLLSEFQRMFRKSVLDVYSEAIRILTEIGKIQIKGDRLLLLPDNYLDKLIISKFFYDEETLEKMDKTPAPKYFHTA